VPRNVRNFWITLNVDGKKTPVATGPRSRAGGFRCRILMRGDGAISDEDLVVEGSNHKGLLRLTVWVRGEAIFSRTTKV
jgi:hypothetical protein